MRYSFLGSMTVLLAGASLAVAQPWAGSKPVASTPTPSAHGSSLPPPVWSKEQGAPETCLPDDCLQPTAPCEDRVWSSASYLLWWIKPGPSQPLVTTGVDGVPPGAIGQPDTVVLFPDPDINYKPFHGGRLSIGFAIDDFKTKAIELSVFALGGREDLFQLSSDDTGFPVIARPFLTDPPEFDVNGGPLTPGEDVHFVSNPGEFVGSVRVSSNADIFGGELNFACSLVDVGPLAVDGFVGVRYLYLREELNIRDQTTSIGGDIFFDIDGDGDADLVDTNLDGDGDPQTNPDSTGAFVSTNDIFKTTNHFYGGQIGLRGEYNCGAFYVMGKTKVALGNTHQTVRIAGNTVVGLPDGTTFFTNQGGVLALATNIGEESKDSFAVIPEVELNVGFHLTERIRVFAGYTFVYWSSVVRPGEQIDHTINPVFLPTSNAFGPAAGGPVRPRLNIETTDFWMHGLNAGFAYHW